MQTRVVQRRVSVPPEKVDLILKNFDKMKVTELAVLIGESYQKTVLNAKLLGLTKKNFDIDDNLADDKGYFSVEKFSRLYKY